MEEKLLDILAEVCDDDSVKQILMGSSLIRGCWILWRLLTCCLLSRTILM